MERSMRVFWTILTGVLVFCSPLHARGGGGCFTPDTPVMVSETQSRPIGELKVGDPVLCRSDDGHLVTSAVRRMIRQEVDEVVELQVGAVTLWTTRDHPFFEGENFRPLGELSEKDRLYVWVAGQLGPRAFKILSVRKGKVQVCNLEVGEPHTFFAAGVLVHNKGGGCFPWGTPVSTPQGDRPIEKLAPGDLVWGSDGRGGLGAVNVVRVIQLQDRLVEVTTQNHQLTTTADHPLGLLGGGYRQAGDLKAGEPLLVWKDGLFQVDPVVRVRFLDTPVPVVNLEVGGTHTFLAGNFLVHNKGGGGGGGGGGGHGGGFYSSGGGGVYSSGGGDATGLLESLIVIVIICFAACYGIPFIIRWFRENNQDRSSSAEKSLPNGEVRFTPSQVRLRAEATEKLYRELVGDTGPLALDTVKKECGQIFLLLQDCWEKRSYAPLQKHLGPSLYARHLKQIDGLLRSHEINKIDQLKVRDISLVRLNWQREPKTISLLFSAEAKDYYVDDQTGEKLRGDWLVEPFQEVWIFRLEGGRWILGAIEQVAETRELDKDNVPTKAAPQVAPGVMNQESPMASGPVDEPAWTDLAAEVFTLWYLSLEAGRIDDKLRAHLSADQTGALERQILRMKNSGGRIAYRNFCLRQAALADSTRIQGVAQSFTVRMSAHYFDPVRDMVVFTVHWSFENQDGTWKLTRRK